MLKFLAAPAENITVAVLFNNISLRLPRETAALLAPNPTHLQTFPVHPPMIKINIEPYYRCLQNWVLHCGIAAQRQGRLAYNKW